jgi:predicted dehydrogenase
MKNGVLQVAQIGCGAFAAEQDLPNFARHPQLECKWCCDVSESQAQSLAERFEVPHSTSDYRKVLADPDIDFIKIATSHEAHLELIEAAAAAGKHVFCEKPLAMETGDALRIISAVRRGGIKLCVDFNRRQAPSLRVLRQRWQGHISAPRHHPWRYTESVRAVYPEESVSHFLVRIQDDTLSYRLAHLDPLRGGGQIIGESVHWLDLACWWFAPQHPIEIVAWGSTRFTHGINMTFSEGDTATILFHCGGTFDYPKELYEVTSQGALFRNHCFVENQYFGVPGLERETFALQRDALPEVGEEGGLAGYMKKSQARVKNLSNSKEGHSQLMADKGHEAMLDAFVDAIHSESPSPCDEMAGYLSTYLAQLAIRSIELRQTLPVLREKVDFTVL